MFNVESISREVIQSWPVAGSGLPERVVNGARQAGIRTIGELRTRKSEELINLRSIGRISLRDIHHYFDMLNQIEHGKQFFLTIQEVFDEFLSGEELDILIRRYGLMREEGLPARNFMTLQEIGNGLNLTRERIRQIEFLAFDHLRSRIATACLQPFHRYIRAFIQSRQRVADANDLQDLAGQSWLANYHPGSLVLLLHDIGVAPYTEYRGCFSLWTAEETETVVARAHAWLEDQTVPCSAESVFAALPGWSPEWSARALGKLLAHAPDVMATKDGRFFIFDAAGEAFLAELLAGFNTAPHYRVLAGLMNERLKPHCRKGSGFVLKALSTGGFEKLERGRYALPERTELSH